jgi:hypothetical protein
VSRAVTIFVLVWLGMLDRAEASAVDRIVCLSGPALAGPARSGTVVGALPSTDPALALPGILIVSPQPSTGALLVPLSLSLPTVPGASPVVPQVITLVTPFFGSGGALGFAQRLTLQLRPAGVPEAPGQSPVSCF